MYGTRHEAEVALARLRIAAHDRRLPRRGTAARSVSAVFQAYVEAVESGLIELSPRTLVSVRSAVRRMAATELAGGQPFGDLLLAQLTWQEIEDLYQALRRWGLGPAWIRRCARAELRVCGVEELCSPGCENWSPTIRLRSESTSRAVDEPLGAPTRCVHVAATSSATATTRAIETSLVHPDRR